MEIDNDVSTMNDDLTDSAMQQKNKLIQEQQKIIQDRELELREKNAYEEKSVRTQIENMKNTQKLQDDRDTHINEQIQHIELYVKNFVDVYQRKPLREEITDNLKQEINIEILDIFFANYNTNDNV